MKAIALVQPPHEPAMAGTFFGYLLGEGWDVQGFGAQEDVPDDVAAETEFILAALARVDASLIDRCRKLRLIQVPGHGFEHVDVEAARAAGVPVATVASSGAEAHTVAEWAILMAGAASRRLTEGHNALARGEFANVTLMQEGVFELAGKTIGIVGLGRIGRSIARRARGFDMAVLYSKRSRLPESEEREIGATFSALGDLLRRSDFISVSCSLTPQTRHLIGARELALVKPGAILVNTARGPVIDEAALVAALTSGPLAGAGLDVYEEEPRVHPGLLPLRNVVLLPHLGSAVFELREKMAHVVVDNIEAFLAGKRPPNLHNPEIYA